MLALWALVLTKSRFSFRGIDIDFDMMSVQLRHGDGVVESAAGAAPWWVRPRWRGIHAGWRQRRRPSPAGGTGQHAVRQLRPYLSPFPTQFQAIPPYTGRCAVVNRSLN